MKKWFKNGMMLSVITAIVLNMFSSSFASVGASEASSGVCEEDPYAEFHAEINNMVDEIRHEKMRQIGEVESQIYELQLKSNALLDRATNYTDSTYNLNDLEQQYDVLVEKVQDLNVQSESIYYEMNVEVDKALKDRGFVNGSTDENAIMTAADCIDGNIKLQTNPGYMQTESGVYWNSDTREFYYYANYDYSEKNAYGQYVGLNDRMGDYDLISLQHKDDNGWYWTSVETEAWLAVKGINGSTYLGKSNKYGTIYTGDYPPVRVSCRNDFWNGCVFNVDDSAVKIYDNSASEVRHIHIRGWLKTVGSQRSTQVRSDYEHNYNSSIWGGGFSITTSDLSSFTFKLEVTYSGSSIGTWNRSAGSRVAQIPAGC